MYLHCNIDSLKKEGSFNICHVGENWGCNIKWNTLSFHLSAESLEPWFSTSGSYVSLIWDACIAYIYIMILNSSKVRVMKDQWNKLMVRGHHTLGTGLKGHSIRNVENHCPRAGREMWRELGWCLFSGHREQQLEVWWNITTVLTSSVTQVLGARRRSLSPSRKTWREDLLGWFQMAFEKPPSRFLDQGALVSRSLGALGPVYLDFLLLSMKSQCRMPLMPIILSGSLSRSPSVEKA